MSRWCTRLAALVATVVATLMVTLMVTLTVTIAGCASEEERARYGAGSRGPSGGRDTGSVVGREQPDEAPAERGGDYPSVFAESAEEAGAMVDRARDVPLDDELRIPASREAAREPEGGGATSPTGAIVSLRASPAR